MVAMGSGIPSSGRQVVAHLPDGDHPALVTRVNVDGSLSLTIFLVGDITARDNVREYVYEADDEESDKFGFWSWPERVEG